MDLTPDKQQQFVSDAVNKLLERYAGFKRAMDLLPEGGYDTELADRLAEAGFLDAALGDETGPLEAALIVHEVARAAGTVSFAASALVAPMVLGKVLEGPIALACLPASQPLRFGGHARTVLIDAGKTDRQILEHLRDSRPGFLRQHLRR